MSLLTADLRSSENDPNDPAFAEGSDSDEDEVVQPARKRPKGGAGAGAGIAGATARRQFIELSSDSDAGIELDPDTVDLCGTSGGDDDDVHGDDDDDEDSDEDSSDYNGNTGDGRSTSRIGDHGSTSNASMEQRAATRKAAPQGMGDLTIPPFTGGARAAGRGAGGANGGGGGSATVDLAVSSDSSDSSDNKSDENFIPLTKPSASAPSRNRSVYSGSSSSAHVEAVGGPASRALQTGQQFQSSRGVLLIIDAVYIWLNTASTAVSAYNPVGMDPATESITTESFHAAATGCIGYDGLNSFVDLLGRCLKRRF